MRWHSVGGFIVKRRLWWQLDRFTTLQRIQEGHWPLYQCAGCCFYGSGAYQTIFTGVDILYSSKPPGTAGELFVLHQDDVACLRCGCDSTAFVSRYVGPFPKTEEVVLSPRLPEAVQ